MMLREGKIAFDGGFLSTIPSTELAGKKERTRNTNTKTYIHNPIQRFPLCAETKLLDIPRIQEFGIVDLECPNLCRAYPLRPAVQTRHDMECDCIALADASRSVQPSFSSLRGIPNICFLWHYTGVSISVRILPRSSNNVGSVSLSTVFRPSNNIHSSAKVGISIPLLSRGYCDRLVDKKLFAENSEPSCKRLFMFSFWRLVCWRSRNLPIKHMSSCRSLAPFPNTGTTCGFFGNFCYHFLERGVVVGRAISNIEFALQKTGMDVK